jgi:hypothetical protein
VYAAVGLLLLAPLALAPAWSPRDLVWPAVFGYLGDARWASIYAVAAGATLVWTSTWGTGVPWHGGVPPGAVPDGTVAGLGLVTWVVLACWAAIGWRTVAVEAGAAGSGRVDAGAVGERAGEPGAVDNAGALATRSATLPPRGVDPGEGGFGAPPNDPVSQGAGPSRGSVGLPK